MSDRKYRRRPAQVGDVIYIPHGHYHPGTASSTFEGRHAVVVYSSSRIVAHPLVLGLHRDVVVRLSAVRTKAVNLDDLTEDEAVALALWNLLT